MCDVLGYVTVGIKVEDKNFVLDVLVIPDLPHSLILGADFWRITGVVPNLRDGNWTFSVDAIAEHLKPQTELSAEENFRLNSLLETQFNDMKDGVGCTNLVEHKIVTSASPIKQRYYPVSPVVQKAIDEQLDEMLRDGIVEPSNSPWASPIVLVKKKDGSYRFCVDYRKLNKVTVRDAYPIPMVSNTLDKLRNAKYLTTLDIKSAYWQIPMAEDSKPHTAFTVPNRGLFQFRRMPFGLSNSPATWQRFIDLVIAHDLEPFVFVYLDDIVIVTPDFETHLKIIEEVFSRLRNAGLTVSRDKCQFCKPELKYLGYIVDRNGLHVDPEKVQAILQIPSPTNVGEVRRIIGMTSWYRRFIPDYSTLTAPITKLLRKNSKFLWTDECDDAFRTLKQILISAPVLSCPDFSLPFVIQCDASGYGLGAVLTQQHVDGERVVAYISRSLTKNERNFTVTERECLAVLWAIERLRPYIEGVKFSVITDHYSLIWLSNLKDPRGRLSRWAVALEQYDFEIIHRKGKDHQVPDCLSRSVPILDSVQVQSSLPVDRWYESRVNAVSKFPEKNPCWRIGDDKCLYKHISSGNEKLDGGQNSWKKVVPKNQRKQLISEAHDLPTSGHLGVFKTYHRLAVLYYWPKMRADVAAYVRKCHTCLSQKPEQKSPPGLMLSRSYVSKPWEVISADLMGPLPKSSQGYRFILVVCDYFSKFTLTFPLRTATASAVAKIIEDNVFLLFGVPASIIVDNGVQFRSHLFSKLMANYHVKIRFTANYHPQANPTERVNRVLKTMLSSYVEDNQRNWDKILAKVTCAIRSSKHEVTRHSPYYVNFGREMILKGDDQLFKDKDQNISKRDNEALDERRTEFERLYTEVKERLSKAYQNNARIYNLRRRDVQYIVGQPVYKRNFVLSDAAKYYSAKLAPKYTGPFIIHKKVSPWTYELKDLRGSPRGTWHVKDLKPNPDTHEL